MFELAILMFLLAVLSQLFMGSLILLSEIKLSFSRLTIINVLLICIAMIMSQFQKVENISCAPPQVVTMILGIVAIEIQLLIMALQIVVIGLKSPKLTEEAMSRL